MCHHIDFDFCTNLLIMSSSDEIVMQKKDADTPVTWSDYEHLRDHLTAMFDKSVSTIDRDMQDLQLQLGGTNTNVQAIETKVDTVQTSVHTLQQSIDALRQAFEQHRPHQQQFGDAFDDDSVHDNIHAHARGRANPVQGRGFAPLGRAQRVPLPAQDDGLGKPKFSIPRFSFDTADVEEYLTWELKIEKLWRLHDYTEDRKVKLASAEFEDRKSVV